MVVGAIPAGEKPGRGLEKVEEVLGKVLTRRIEVWWPEERDRRKEATAARAAELRSSLVEVRKRKEEEMTGGSYIQINIWVLPERTVRHSLADCPRGWMLQSFALKEISSRDFNGDAEI